MNYNIINEYINFAKSCINKYLKKILGKYYDQDLVNRLIKIYINSRYYDIYLSSGRDLAFNIRENVIGAANALKNGDNNIKLDNIVKVFEYIFYFDNVLECESINEKINEIEVYRKEQLNINKNKKFNIDLFNTIKDDLIKKKEYIDTIENKKFEFDYELTNIKNVYDVCLNQNLKFPFVYNSTVIDKIFNSSEISQRKAAVEFSYASLKVLKDIIKGNFEYKYLVKYPGGISKKKSLNNKLYSIIDNDMLRDKIFIKILYSDFLKEKDEIYTHMRKGYKYVIILDEAFIDNEDSIKLLSIFKYIMLKRSSLVKGMEKFSNIIYI